MKCKSIVNLYYTGKDFEDFFVQQYMFKNTFTDIYLFMYITPVYMLWNSLYGYQCLFNIEVIIFVSHLLPQLPEVTLSLLLHGGMGVVRDILKLERVVAYLYLK